MQIIKYLILFVILIISSIIGRMLSKKYIYRLAELEEMQNALNVLKNKIRFTYSPIPEVFEEISKMTSKEISKIFKKAKSKMQVTTAGMAWEEAIEESQSYLNKEDKQKLKTLSKLLGKTDTDGQISQIEITENFLQEQVKQATKEKEKNEKLYLKLGTIMGLAIVVILC